MREQIRVTRRGAVCVLKIGVMGCMLAAGVAWFPTRADAQLPTSCPTSFTLEPLAGVGTSVTLTRIDTGWPGYGHHRELTEKRTLQLGLSCPSGTPPCGVCTITGLVAPLGRCNNDRTVACNVVNGPDAVNCGGNTCDFFFLTPSPEGIGGNPVCVATRLASAISGTVQPETGNITLNVDGREDIFLGISQEQPCPICGGDPQPNDAVRGGTCVGGTRNGLSCDVNAIDSTYGSVSLDCPPNPGTLITGAGARRDLHLSTSGDTLVASQACTAAGSSGLCPCRACLTDSTRACASDSDCFPTGGLKCLGTAGEPTKRNACSDGVCSDSGDGLNGVCAAGPVDSWCDGLLRVDGEPVIPCTTNPDCDTYDPICPGGNCGTCSINRLRSCFLDTIVAPAYADAVRPLLSDVLCIPPTANTAVNVVLGLPGPERFRMQANVTGVCQAGDNCPLVNNPDQLNSDCPNAAFFNCGGCGGTVPPQLAGCCDGGDACDPCPAQANNTNCNQQRSSSANIGPAGGVVQTDEVNGTITATVEVPPGALATATTVSVTENGSVTNFSLRKEGAATDVLAISARPEAQHFNVPVKVTIRWDDRDKDGIVDRGTCIGGGDDGLPCDANGDCASNSCSNTSTVLESSLILKRNTNRFSKSGIGVSPFTCADHLTGSGCETAHADCNQPAGTGTATVARCCDPTAGTFGTRTYGLWEFETCDFSEFMIGLEAAGLVPGKGSLKTDCAMEWAPNVPLNEPYSDSSGFPNSTITCHDGDLSCDRDGDVNGSCAFEIGLCMNVDDPRLVKNGVPQCTPSGVVSWTLLKPKSSATSAVDIANTQALTAAASSLGGSFNGVGVVYSPMLSGPSVCSAPAVVRVPLAAPDKAGNAVLKTKTAMGPPPGKSKGPKDADTLKLTCLPAPAP